MLEPFLTAMRTRGLIAAIAVLAVMLAVRGGVEVESTAAAPGDILAAVGDVTDTTAVLWLRAPTAGPIAVELSGGADTPRTLTVEPSPARDFTGRVKLDALAPATRYEYRAHAAGRFISGSFLTAPPPDRDVPVRVLWSADVGARGFCRGVDQGYAVFDVMASRHPDRFVFLGDTIYADHRCAGGGVADGGDVVATTLAEFHAKHRYHREDAAMQRFLRRTAVWATWDDHEVRGNFAGPTEPLMPVGRQAFVDYWPIGAPADDPSRLYRRVRYGSLIELFVLDTRQYRSDNCSPDRAGKTLLGDRQRRWLIDRLTSSTAVWRAVASSVPLSISKAWPCGDSWASSDLVVMSTGFARERDAILRELRDRSLSNVVVLAGDAHFAMLAVHEPWPGFRLHEFVAGPLAARPKRARQPDGTLGSRILFSAGGAPNFGELDIDRDGLTVRIFSGDGERLGMHRLPRENERVTVRQGNKRSPVLSTAYGP